MTNTCASPLILGASGDNANGLYTSGSFGAVDVVNPDQPGHPRRRRVHVLHRQQGLSDTFPTSGAGWLRRGHRRDPAPCRPSRLQGLTQASIINQARNFEFKPSMVRDNITYKTSGDEDGYLVESVQIVQYDSTTKFLNDVGELITRFESS